MVIWKLIQIFEPLLCSVGPKHFVCFWVPHSDSCKASFIESQSSPSTFIARSLGLASWHHPSSTTFLAVKTAYNALKFLPDTICRYGLTMISSGCNLAFVMSISPVLGPLVYFVLLPLTGCNSEYAPLSHCLAFPCPSILALKVDPAS